MRGSIFSCLHKLKAINLSRNFNLKFAILIFKFSRYCNSDHWYHISCRLGSLITMGRQPFGKGNILLGQRKSVSALTKTEREKQVFNSKPRCEWEAIQTTFSLSPSLASRQDREPQGRGWRRTWAVLSNARSRVSDFNLVPRVSLPKWRNTLRTKLCWFLSW